MTGIGVFVIAFVLPVLLNAQDHPIPKTDALISLGSEIRSLSERISPAVVQIVVHGYGTLEHRRGQAANAIGPQEYTGSGVILDATGYIMTNAHVVTGAISTKVLVTKPNTSDSFGGVEDTDSLDAKIVGLDTEADLALLKVEKTGLPSLTLDTEDVHQGDLVLAVGAPFGLRNSVSLGVVSAPERWLGDNSPMVYIQTDASVNPGNSGGALVGMNGRLVGINTFILTQSGGNEGLGFAIPVATIRDVYAQLRKDGRVRRGEIGVTMQDITPILAKGLSLGRDRGAVVADVAPNGPAEQAGLKRGDVVLTLGGRRVLSSAEIENQVFRRQSGDTLDFGVLRQGSRLNIKIQVRERKNTASELSALIQPGKSLVPKLGVFCIEINKDNVNQFPELRREYGLIVAGRSAGGQSQPVDLQPGDVIVAINTYPVPFVDSLVSALDRMKPGDPVVLQIERDGEYQYVAFELDR